MLRSQGLQSSTQRNPLLAPMSTPLLQPAWATRLQSHPDPAYARYILEGIERGFRIGVNPICQVQSALRNMPSAKEHAGILNEYIGKETAAGRILGPFPKGIMPGVQINRIGVIPKKNQPGKWRIITDLSFPEGSSVNDAIDSKLCSLQYVSVDQVAAAAQKLGPGALMAKIDIKAAYRIIPVHQLDRAWLGMCWEGAIYIDGMLPFGLCSAPKIFTAVADALEWCIAKQGVEWIYHYLDDFITLGPPQSDVCMRNLQLIVKECRELGVPLAPEKQEGPSPVITFLGIQIDTQLGILRLPEEKLQRLLQMTTAWLKRKACTRRELESLIGSLQHAFKVVRPGRSFLRQAISLLSVAKRPHHHIRLNQEFRSDIMWWAAFARQWNGTSLLTKVDPTHQIAVTSDASGSWGCGAWWGTKWFQLQWDKLSSSLQIAVKELIPIVIAAAIWGQYWQGCSVVSYCDNMAVVAVLNSRYSRERTLMQLLRYLFFIEAYCQFQLSAVHLPGELNTCADDLSRDRLAAFRSRVQQADRHPSPFPASLLQWLLQQQMDWTSHSWMQQFTTFVKRD